MSFRVFKYTDMLKKRVLEVILEKTECQQLHVVHLSLIKRYFTDENSS